MTLEEANAQLAQNLRAHRKVRRNNRKVRRNNQDRQTDRQKIGMKIRVAHHFFAGAFKVTLATLASLTSQAGG